MRKIYLFIVSFFYLTGIFASQFDRKIDSLLVKLDNPFENDGAKTLSELQSIFDIKLTLSSNKKEIVLQIAKIYESAGQHFYYKSELNKAKKYLLKAEKVYRSNHDTVGLASTIEKMVHIYLEIGDYSKAHKLNEQVRIFSLNISNKILIAKSLRNAGLIYYYRNEYKKALENYFEALLVYNDLADTVDIGFIYNAIGIIYNRWELPHKSILFFGKAEKVYRNNNNPRRLSQVLNNLADVYTSSVHNNNMALQLFIEALELKRQINDQIGIALIYNNIGTVYGNMEEYQKACNNLLKSKSIYEKLENQPGLIMVNYNIGKYFFGIEQYENAIHYFKLSLNAAKEIEYNDYISNNYKALTESYAANGNYKEFDKYYKLDQFITDSLLSRLNNAELLQVEAEFNERIVTNENISLKNKIKEQKIVLRRNQFFLLGTCFVVFVLVIVIGINYSRKK